MISAWVAENSLSFEMFEVESKTDEITAIPKLLDNLDVEGAAVSIDEIGAHIAIVNKTRDKKANYFMALKENQGKSKD